MATVTLKTIAEQCGLSCAAVSKALHHLPGVSEEKAEMVRATARGLGYYPNAAARTLKTNQSHNIGIIFENGMSHEFFSQMLDEIRSCLEEQNYDITLMSNRFHREGGYYGHVMRRQCDGVIIIKAQQYRSQELNRADALERLNALVNSVAVPPRVLRATKPTYGSQQRRLQSKTQRGETKALRGRVRDGA